MFIKKALLLFVAVSAASLLFTSCTKKPKIDLNGLQQNPSAINGDVAADGNDFGGDSFVAGPTDVADFENGGNSGNGDDVQIGVGKWDDLDKPVAGSEMSDFVKNGQRWDGVVYFGYDQSDVQQSERTKLDTLAAYLKENANLGVVIEGHTDEKGSDEYNRALGERRALAVQQYLGLLGISDSRMQTLSYGEDKPAVPGATSDADMALNRRAEFIIGDL
ncbi:MAG: OmpA family protein [Lentisphaeria bacterium]|nr:OmpA family protein [Lentisphaeria bacterium]